MRIRTCLATAYILLMSAFAVTSLAAPGTISAKVSASHSGPIRVGDIVQVTLRISGHADPAEIDGFNLTVIFDGAVFQYVPEPLDLGDASGIDQQWLSKPNQEDAASGYGLASFVEASTPGELMLSVVELSHSNPERGTVSSSGFLVSFELVAIGEGTTDVTPAPFLDGSTLFDTTLSPVPTPSFVGDKKVKVKRGR